MLIVDDLINDKMKPQPLPKVKEGFIHEDYKTGAKFIYIRGEKQKSIKDSEVEKCINA